jgi:hypothetical protein
MGFNDLPLAVFLVHLEHDAIAPVIGHIYVKQGIGIARDHSKIKFSKTVKCFYQLGKMYVSGEIEVHSVQFESE